MNNKQRVFCQLALANFQNRLNFKVEEKSLQFGNEENHELFGDASINFVDTKYSVNLEFTYSVIEEMTKFKGSYLQPPDPNDFILNDVIIKSVFLIHDDEETKLSLSSNVKLFSEYLVCLIIEQEFEINCNNFFRYITKNIQSSFKNTHLDLVSLKENSLNSIKKIIHEVLNEIESTKEQRYVVSMDFYIYAKDDNEAIKLAKHIVEKEDEKYDNAASLISVHKQPFGVLDSSLIWGKKND